MKQKGSRLFIRQQSREKEEEDGGSKEGREQEGREGRNGEGGNIQKGHPQFLSRNDLFPLRNKHLSDLFIAFIRSDSLVKPFPAAAAAGHHGERRTQKKEVPIAEECIGRTGGARTGGLGSAIITSARQAEAVQSCSPHIYMAINIIQHMA